MTSSTTPADEPWLCATCSVEYPPAADPPEVCPICSDDRQYVFPVGQRWTTLSTLRTEGHRGAVVELEPRLHGVRITPSVGIGQQAILVPTEQGSLLWDPTGYVDDDLAAAVLGVGPVAAIASSHPHMFGVQVEWSRRLGDAPVWVNAADAEWVQRPDPAIRTWTDEAEPVPGVTLHRIGGHFPGSAVAHLTGADGQGVLLTGDTVAGTPDQHWVSFLRSYPNKVPLSAAVIGVVAERVGRLDFDRLYDNFDGRVLGSAREWVQRSAERYIGWVSGAYDHLTGTV